MPCVDASGHQRDRSSPDEARDRRSPRLPASWAARRGVPPDRRASSRRSSTIPIERREGSMQRDNDAPHDQHCELGPPASIGPNLQRFYTSSMGGGHHRIVELSCKRHRQQYGTVAESRTAPGGRNIQHYGITGFDQIHEALLCWPVLPIQRDAGERSASAGAPSRNRQSRRTSQQSAR